jgi:hypothetical protein
MHNGDFQRGEKIKKIKKMLSIIFWRVAPETRRARPSGDRPSNLPQRGAALTG